MSRLSFMVALMPLSLIHAEQGCPEGGCPIKVNSMMQAHQISQIAKEGWVDEVKGAMKLAEDVKIAVESINGALKMFENDQGEEGLNTIILACSEFQMKQTENETEKQKLSDDTDALLELVAEGAELVEWKDAVLADLKLFTDNGDLDALARVVSSTLDMYTKAFPDIDDETKQALESFEIIVMYTLDYVALLGKESTDPMQATEDYYKNLVGAVVAMLGGEDDLTEDQKTIIGVLDATLGDLVNIAANYKAEMARKELCLPVVDITPRPFKGKKPNTCADDRVFKYGKCIREGQNLFDSLKAPKPSCPDDTQQCHGNCVKNCPEGSKLSTPPFKCHCKLEGSHCPGSHPQELLFGAFCGKDKNSLSKYGEDLHAAWNNLKAPPAEDESEIATITNTVNAGINLRAEIKIPSCVEIQG